MGIEISPGREYIQTEYAQYLRSRHWRRRRAAFARTHPKVCPCSSTERIELHHKTYERLGCELDEDLMWLCRRCHTLVEGLIDQGLLSRSLEDFFSKERSIVIEKEPFVPKHLRDAKRNSYGELVTAGRPGKRVQGGWDQ